MFFFKLRMWLLTALLFAIVYAVVSMLSYAAGSRFLQLLGGVCLSFYDWYSDLRPPRPKVGPYAADSPGTLP
jgi:nitrate reductase alpha subunit